MVIYQNFIYIYIEKKKCCLTSRTLSEKQVKVGEKRFCTKKCDSLKKKVHIFKLL